MRLEACALALGLVAGCVSPAEVGVLEAPDGGLEPAALLQLQLQGRWCGTARSVLETREIRLEIGPDTYTVHCNCDCECSEPFPGESAADGSAGRYAITDYTLNGEGWGRAEQELPSGAYARVRLEHIELDGDTLRFERQPRYGGQRVFVDLERCTRDAAAQ